MSGDLVQIQIDIIRLDIDLLLKRIDETKDKDLLETLEVLLDREEKNLQYYRDNHTEYFI